MGCRPIIHLHVHISQVKGDHLLLRKEGHRVKSEDTPVFCEFPPTICRENNSFPSVKISVVFF